MIDQAAIAVTGVMAVWLSQDKRSEFRKWACIFGLLGEPFWFYSAWVADQWGIMILVFFYAAGWGRGFWNNWVVTNAN